jgi:hypothetical protein
MQALVHDRGEGGPCTLGGESYLVARSGLRFTAVTRARHAVLGALAFSASAAGETYAMSAPGRRWPQIPGSDFCLDAARGRMVIQPTFRPTAALQREGCATPQSCDEDTLGKRE